MPRLDAALRCRPARRRRRRRRSAAVWTAAGRWKACPLARVSMFEGILYWWQTWIVYICRIRLNAHSIIEEEAAA